MRSAALGQNRIRHPAAKFRKPSRRVAAGSAARHERVVEVGEREHRHPIPVAVETIQVGVLIPAAFEEHLHREGLPRRV